MTFRTGMTSPGNNVESWAHEKCPDSKILVSVCGGADIGILSWLAFASANRPLGITTTAFEPTATFLIQTSDPNLPRPHAYYQDSAHSPVIGWEWMLEFAGHPGFDIRVITLGENFRNGQPLRGLWIVLVELRHLERCSKFSIELESICGETSGL